MFIDETWASTKMARRHGRAPRGRASARRRPARSCVDAPSGARRISETGAARDRVLPCVRPLMRHGSWPRARMGLRGSGPHHWNALEALPMRLVLPTPPHRRCAIPVLRPPHALRQPRARARLRGDGRSSVDPALRQQGPSDARVLVRQRHDDQHRRLARQHPAEPRAGRHALALGPAHDTRWPR